MKIGYDIYYSPIGMIHVVVDELGVKKVEIFEEDWVEYKNKHEFIQRDVKLCEEVMVQLDEYFKGKRKSFNIPLSIEGTDFRKKVWKALQDIPYGETRNYLQIAEAIGNPKAVRAVGQANKNNQLPIIVPCHRVIGKSGNLVGFAGNRTPTQKLLLEIEGVKVEK
ncbi:methylated-DNA--[protein]-cysteine S-methyltransferase [Clostridium bowmanii]|uniref:methylated-DNA--[protein]-cysteine S-methyltransferase n=1 Tax=Clostridium bowmanii TaxID=132925 RepID=UPI001C0CAD93|nr:methylated-DNA--[protein]-cysteine S-methyltransferase [Clostridium bowmanii]MBU3190431.1 methylated-DNA--[protein]-cysteine S-methyltransferase [Clostridium bowmanii]MCA1074945.1 methylated-DNA--[protein]-cysteine S-methyltransferase [Clostridium bowmanii]